jgi:hypothetical protein
MPVPTKRSVHSIRESPAGNIPDRSYRSVYHPPINGRSQARQCHDRTTAGLSAIAHLLILDASAGKTNTMWGPCDASFALAKSKRVSTNAGIKELDFESSVCDRPGLPDQLIQAPVSHSPPSFSVHIEAVVRTGRSAIEFDAKANGVAV